MPSRPSRREPRRSDDSYLSQDAYPDPAAAAENGEGYEYMTDDNYDAGPRDPPRRRRAPSQDRRSTRASDHDRGSSPPAPAPRSRRDVSPSAAPRSSRPSRHAAAHGAVSDKRESEGQGGDWKDKLRNYGGKGLKGLSTMAASYAARQAVGSSSRDKSADREDDDAAHDRRSGRRSRRRSPSSSLSPSPHRHRRPPMNGRHKSYSVSPPPSRTRGRGRRDNDDRPSRRRRSYSSSSGSESPPRHRRHRSEGGGRGSRARSRSRSKSSARGGGRSRLGNFRNNMRAPSPDVASRWQMAARAALQAGGMTAFRLRKAPGPWTGEKGAKVITAALGAAAIDAFVDKDPRRERGSGVKGLAESVIGGMLANKLMGFKGATKPGGRARYGGRR